MKKFNRQILELAKQAAFQNKPVLVLSTTSEELTCAYQGHENELVGAMSKALENDPDLYRIIKRSVQEKENKDLTPTIIRINQSEVLSNSTLVV